jgi:hypothetical protein
MAVAPVEFSAPEAESLLNLHFADTLLPKLLSGELSVAAAEESVHNPGRQTA